MEVGVSWDPSPQGSLALAVSWGTPSLSSTPLDLSAEPGCVRSGSMSSLHLPYILAPCTQCGHTLDMESFSSYGLGLGITLL